MLNFARADPLGFVGMLRRRAVEQLSTPPPGVVQTKFSDVKYEVDLSLHRQMKKYYFHTHEMFLERIFNRFLAPGSVFIDIGANCGYWSASALSRVGTSGEVHAFEPVPQYFAFVQRLAQLNPSFNLMANNIACGSGRSSARMAIVLPRPENFDNADINIGSSSLTSGFLSHAEELTESIDVDIIALDDYVSLKSIDPNRIGLIKIDVEGYEETVLKGMTQLLSKAGRKVPVLCEILTDLTRPQPLDGRKIVTRMERFGYRCLNATNLKPIDIANLSFEENVLCL
jgi:FkbM family methyltransferase